MKNFKVNILKQEFGGIFLESKVSQYISFHYLFMVFWGEKFLQI